MPYIPHTQTEIKQMLEQIGIASMMNFLPIFLQRYCTKKKNPLPGDPRMKLYAR